MAEASPVSKMYVDPDLCTGCGICTQVCGRGAISLAGSVATIDEALCTRCGVCIEECPLGAIVSLEVVSQTQTTSPQRHVAPVGQAPGAPVGETPSAPALRTPLGSALSGLLTVAGWILDRRTSRGGAGTACGRSFSRQRLGGQGRGGRRARRRSRWA